MFRPLLYLVLLKAVFMAAVIVYAGIGLGPDEAQYWTWSQELDWGYYSKPPGIAWQIWLGTQLFGNTEWGVRSVSCLLSILQALAVYLLALRVGLSRRTAFWCGMLMAFTPIGFIGSFFAITDVGFLLCWTGACFVIVSALNEKKEADPLVVGAWILAGALFKWPMYLFWVFYLLCRYWYFGNQGKGRLLAGMALSLGALLPSIWWNAAHDWATFRHVFATLHGGSGSTKGASNIGEFLGGQALLLSPILFFLLLLGFLHWYRQRKHLPPALFFCGFVTIASFASSVLVASFQKVQGNWIIFAYPTAMILLGWNCFQARSRQAIWAKIGLGLSVAFSVMLVLMPTLTPYLFEYRHTPFKHHSGWIEIGKILSKHGYESSKNFIVSDKYQTTSILSFYSPGQKRAYFLNVHGSRKNQFSYWPSLQDEQKGDTGFFVWIENAPHLNRWEDKMHFYQEELKKYFESVEFLELAPLLIARGETAKAALIFRCQNCIANAVTDTDRY